MQGSKSEPRKTSKIVIQWSDKQTVTLICGNYDRTAAIVAHQHYGETHFSFIS